jgi:hypothetical protein
MVRPVFVPTVAVGGVIRVDQGEDAMTRTAAASAHRGPFQVDEDAALAELELAWAAGGYRAFSADSGTWSAISSAGEMLAGATPDELDRAIRAHWWAMQ